MSSLVSVIVPVYNVKRYLGKCLKSLSRQTYENIEIIIVDDGSTDGSEKICDEFAKKELRARVFHKKNGGLSSARNFGIKKARGEYLAFVDSDDFVDENFIKKLFQAIVDANAEIAVCGYNDTRPAEKKISGKDATIKLLTKQENIEILTWNKLYAKKVFLESNIEFPVGKKHEDTLTTYKVLAAASRVVYLAESLYHYNDRADSITGSEKMEERLAARELAAKESIEYFKDDKKLRDAAFVCLLLAKYAFLNYALFRKIGQKYGDDARKWICDNQEKYKNNRYTTKKLKVYNYMVCNFGGVFYKIFRKLKHE